MNDWKAPNKEYAPPKPNEPPLHRAARFGDHVAIRQLIAEGADANAVFDLALHPEARLTPATPLVVAAGSGDGASLETVRLLISLGADPTGVREGGSPVGFACTGLGWNYRPGGDGERLEFFLESIHSQRLTAPEAAWLLCKLAGVGDAVRLRVLLRHGANPDGYWDAEEAKREAVRMREEMKRFRDSESQESDKELREIRDELDEELTSKMASAPTSFEIPLFLAASSGSTECVRMLLDAGADIRRRDDSSQTALWEAENPEIARLLVEQGLDLEDRDQYEWTPLNAAVIEGETAISRVKAFIAAGADANATHDRGYTVFMSAVGSGRHPEMLRLLMAAGADAHAVSDLGYNAFHAAIDVDGEARAEQSVRDTLTYLNELGVDIEHRNDAGFTPLAQAIEKGRGTDVRVLSELGANPNASGPRMVCDGDSCRYVTAPLIFAAISAAVDPDEKLRPMLKAGVNLDVRSESGFTPLQHAENRLTSLRASEPCKYTKEWIQEVRHCIQLLRQAGSP